MQTFVLFKTALNSQTMEHRRTVKTFQFSLTKNLSAGHLRLESVAYWNFVCTTLSGDANSEVKSFHSFFCQNLRRRFRWWHLFRCICTLEHLIWRALRSLMRIQVKETHLARIKILFSRSFHFTKSKHTCLLTWRTLTSCRLSQDLIFKEKPNNKRSLIW